MNNIEKKNEIVAWLLSKFMAERNKIISTAVLFCVMGFMWYKVLFKDTPSQAKASDGTTSAQLSYDIHIDYIDLPVVEGRNNKLSTDFFSPDAFDGFGAAGNLSNTVTSNSLVSDIELAARSLNLGAILSGSNPEVFINDNLFGIGDKLTVESDGQHYVFTLVKIMQDKAQLKCNDKSVIIAIAGSNTNK